MSSEPQKTAIRDAYSPVTKRFHCSFHGCSKQFIRKEHLSRHLKSHNPSLEHRCYVCGRGYARSDVLKRHLDNHPQIPSSRHLVACVTCAKRKLKCDDGTPCRACVRNSTECSRTFGGSEKIIRTSPTNDEESSAYDTTPIIDPSTPYENPDAMNPDMTVIPDQHHHLWSSPNNDVWPLHYSSNTVVPTIAASSGIFDIDSWSMDTNNIIDEETQSNLPIQISTNMSDTSMGGKYSYFETPCLNVDSIGSTPSLTASEISYAAKFPSSTTYESSLNNYMLNDIQAIKRLVSIYFSEVHPYWPVLDASTFDIGNTSQLLLASMATLTSWLTGERDYQKLHSLVLDAVSSIQLDTNLPLQNLQALLLCIIYITYRLSDEGMTAKAFQLNSLLISSCRVRGVFGGKSLQENHEVYQSLSWLEKEEVHRLALCTFRADAYLSVLLGYPPSIRYEELNIPLPVSSELWSSSTKTEKPGTRWKRSYSHDRPSFCFLMRDILDPTCGYNIPYHLTEADYHLTLCALQAGAWEVGREASILNTPEQSPRSHSDDLLLIWQSHLDHWRISVESDWHLQENYFSGHINNSESIFAPLSLILWHFFSLRMHAPLKLLQNQSHRLPKDAHTAAKMTQQTYSRVLSWLSSTSSCPRVALWNAAQIARVFVQESTTTDSPLNVIPKQSLRINPLALPALLTSAIVICSCAFFTRSCLSCSKNPSQTATVPVVDVLALSDNDVTLVDWKDRGFGVAIVGAIGAPICRCQIEVLTDWLCKLLGRETMAAGDLVAYVAGLVSYWS